MVSVVLLGCLRCPVCLLGVSKVFMCVQSVVTVCPNGLWCVPNVHGVSRVFLGVLNVFGFFVFSFSFCSFYINLFKELLLVFVQSVRGVFRMYLVCQEWSWCIHGAFVCPEWS